MLTTYRRHIKTCAHRSEGRKYRRCHCPIWTDGFIGREEIRKTLDTRNWEEAQDIIRQWEAEGTRAPEPEAVTIARAWEEFRASWPNRNLGALKKLEYLRAFFRFADDCKWIDENPARKLESPKVQQSPTMPFTPDQMAQILCACEKYGNKARGGRYTGPENARRIRAFFLLLRHSGLRIGDAVTLERSRITGDKLLLYTAKTGTPVHLPLPSFVLTALEAMPRISETYFFWTGESATQSATGDWQRTLKAVFRLAGIPDGHAHRFRDTLAVELLQAGVPMDRVSVILGHSSIKVTEKHYSPWVRARQEQLEADVRRTWETVIPARKGTPEVHEKREAVN